MNCVLFSGGNVTYPVLAVPSGDSVATATQATMDRWLDITAAAGLVLSIAVTLLGAANVPMMLSLWVLYHTLVNVGQHW